MPNDLEASFDFCRRLTRREAGNFYFSFLTLPRAKRDAMCAIYAWMRRLDDRSDDAPSPAAARAAIDEWLKQTHDSLGEGDRSNDPSTINHQPTASPVSSVLSAQDSAAPSSFIPHPSSLDLWPAFAHTVRTYGIPHGHFDEIAMGTLMDQELSRYEAFDDLYRYCYRVASVVGLVCLRVFGYTDRRAEQTGEWLGIAFQLTNILRDVREDAERGRIYIPLEDLRKSGVREEDLIAGRWSEPMHRLFQAFAERIETYYEKARPVTDLVSPEARPTLKIMTEIYHGILEEVRRRDYRVFDHRARVPTWRKMAIVFKHQLGLAR